MTPDAVMDLSTHVVRDLEPRLHHAIQLCESEADKTQLIVGVLTYATGTAGGMLSAVTGVAREEVPRGSALHVDDEPDLYRIGKARAGRTLDGRVHDARPKLAA